MSMSVPEPLVDRPTCIMKDGSLLSLNSLGNYCLPSSFGASFKGTLHVGPSAAIKCSPVPSGQPLAPGLLSRRDLMGAGFAEVTLGVGARNGSLCGEEMCQG